MSGNKRLIWSWMAGAVFLLAVFYAATAWLWSAARTSGASALESQVSSVLANDLAEGNLFKLGASLSRLMQSGSLDYAEIRSFGAGGWETVFRTHSSYGDTGPAFDGFSCSMGRKMIPHRGEGVSLVTTLPSNIEGAECVALLLSSDLPADLKIFKNRLSMAFALLLAGLLVFFLKLTISWHKKDLELEVATRTATAEKEAAIGRLAAQVAHDIRSPLAALEAAAKGLGLLPPEQRALIEDSVNRMQGIADDLLRRYRAPGAVVKTIPVACALAGLIEQVIAEKRLQHKEKTGVKIEFTEASGEIKALVEPKELQRLISNLINNSIESFAGLGTVSVGLSALDGRILIEVKDNGKGIPPGVLVTLGQKGETHGKAGGNGLGLYHARTTIEGWGGSFKIESVPGKGTTVLIELPRSIGQAGGRMAVLLDDDLLVHMNWKLAAKAAGVELKAYKEPAEFLAEIEHLSKDTPVYIDSDLGGSLKGEDVALELRKKGFTDIAMATGHRPDKFAHFPWLKVAGKEPPWG